MCLSYTYLINNQIWSWSPERVTKMASPCRMLFVFPFFPFLQTCIVIFSLFASNENLFLYTWHPTALPLYHLSFNSLFSLASLLNREIRAWILIHVGESPCVPKQFCLSALPSSHPPRPPPSAFAPPVPSHTVVRFCFWPKYWKEISLHAVSKFISYRAKWRRRSVCVFPFPVPLFYILMHYALCSICFWFFCPEALLTHNITLVKVHLAPRILQFCPGASVSFRNVTLSDLSLYLYYIFKITI